MKMTVTLYGAAGEVTGSAYHAQTSRACVMIDFGLFQGREMAHEANHVPRNMTCTTKVNAHIDSVERARGPSNASFVAVSLMTASVSPSALFALLLSAVSPDDSTGKPQDPRRGWGGCISAAPNKRADYRP